MERVLDGLQSSNAYDSDSCRCVLDLISFYARNRECEKRDLKLYFILLELMRWEYMRVSLELSVLVNIDLGHWSSLVKSSSEVAFIVCHAIDERPGSLNTSGEFNTQQHDGKASTDAVECQDQTCPICLNCFNLSSRASMCLQCHHEICKNCLIQLALRRSTSRTTTVNASLGQPSDTREMQAQCPMCRRCISHSLLLLLAEALTEVRAREERLVQAVESVMQLARVVITEVM